MPRQQATDTSWLRYATIPGQLDAPGGVVENFLNGAGANLLVGDAVYISAASTVSKSTAAGNQGKPIGIVVGGDSMGMECSDDPADVGVAIAAVNGGTVLVLRRGKAYVATDAAIAAGVPIAMSTTTAGKVRPAVALSITAGAVAVTSSAANGTADISGDGQTTVIGKMRTATAGAATGLAEILCQ